jgi:hypothetical protein
MEPIQITAHLQSEVVIPSGSIAIDAILAYAVAMRDRLPPPTFGVQPVEIPVQREPGGRFHLASFASATWDSQETRYSNRRFPLAESIHLGAIRRVNTAAGAERSYHLPYTAGHVRGDRLDWYAIADAGAVRDLLATIHYVGKRRTVSYGRVTRWEVESCSPWDGFPVVRDGQALRPLPLDWPGLDVTVAGYATLSYPYWDRTREEMCAVPT